MTNDLLAKWFEEHPGEGKDVARKAVSAATARLAARKARDLARSRKGLLFLKLFSIVGIVSLVVIKVALNLDRISRTNLSK